MATYRIEGAHRRTGRARSFTVSALGEKHALELAAAKEIEGASALRLPDDPPTERQLAYAGDLGIDTTRATSVEHMSSLISVAVRQDKPAAEAHVAIADALGIALWPDIAKRHLFSLIYRWTSRPGQEVLLCAWYAYRVHRHLCDHSDHRGHLDFPSPRFLEVGERLCHEPGMVTSIRRSGEDGAHFVWFGEYTSPQGTHHRGSSILTQAYRRTIELLQEFKPSARLSSPVTHEVTMRRAMFDSPSRVAAPSVTRIPHTCLRCDYVADVAPVETAACPRCGAIYARVQEIVAREHAAIATAKAHQQSKTKKGALNRSAQASASDGWWRRLWRRLISRSPQ